MEEYTYEEIVSKIENIRRFGKATGREVSKELLAYLGNPEKDLSIIHIAGTNGKGSTAAFCSSILKVSGLKVGLFTSPHLITFRERIQINGEYISKEDVIRLGKKVLLAGEKISLEPTMFDIAMAMAFLYFKEKKVDGVVLETGLGGAKDSTRALSCVPKVSVITNIGFDHVGILGDSLGEIAVNKAGIIREGTKVVIAKMDKEAEDVIVSTCEGKEPRVPEMVGKSVSYEKASSVDLKELFERAGFEKVSLGLLGSYQEENAKNAVAAVKAFLDGEKSFNGEKGNSLVGEEKSFNGEKGNSFFGEEWESAFCKGLMEARWPGRMDVVSNDPFVLADGAHNPQGVRALRESLESLYPLEKFFFVVGVLADKDYATMMEEVLPLAEKFYTVTVESSRSLQGEELARVLEAKGVSAKAFSSIDDAFLAAKNEAKNQRIIAFGSLYFIGDVLQYFQNN
ncbi:MAG: bifunctional folylpolyglutamate synthase/dihydrofolate synthase [Lachnospiraceae bacterium]|nr:bifunctional folylpolyglutamate synthase/dihydrofolate synthase [Lachnospiraceae bacterium]